MWWMYVQAYEYNVNKFKLKFLYSMWSIIWSITLSLFEEKIKLTLLYWKTNLVLYDIFCYISHWNKLLTL